MLTYNQVLSTYDVSHVTRLSPFPFHFLFARRESLGTRLHVKYIACTGSGSTILTAHLSHSQHFTKMHLHAHTLLASPPHSPPLLATSQKGGAPRPGKLSTASPPNAGTRAPATASVPLLAPLRSLGALLIAEEPTTAQSLHTRGYFRILDFPRKTIKFQVLMSAAKEPY